jgi:hypothetical protein
VLLFEHGLLFEHVLLFFQDQFFPQYQGKIGNIYCQKALTISQNGHLASDIQPIVESSFTIFKKVGKMHDFRLSHTRNVNPNLGCAINRACAIIFWEVS